MTAPRPGWAAIGSLISEDLLAVPAKARIAAEAAADADPSQRAFHLIDVAYAALLAGEPKRARRVLDEVASLAEGSGMVRHLAAMDQWAAQLDGNWYPGNIGAELSEIVGAPTLVPSPGPPETVFVEHVVARGPVAVLTFRTTLAGALGQGDLAGATLVGDRAIDRLQELAAYARELAMPGVVLWTSLAQADLARRIARIEHAEQVLASVRAEAVQRGMDATLALTHLMEGDWWATPGSSPEALGIVLTARPPAVCATPADLERAASCFHAAEQLMATGAADGAPALWVGLHLRWATLAWLREDHAGRRTHLDHAISAAAATGDGATSRLLTIHLLIADLAEGCLGERIADIGSGWGPPATGTLAEVRQWAEDDGSSSWCTGLGRLLERTADGWRDRGENDRAALAYLGALSLLDAGPRVASRRVAAAVADLDAKRNLNGRALARLERLLTTLPDLTDVHEQLLEFNQEYGILGAIVQAQLARGRAGAAEHAARGLERIRDRLRGLIVLALGSGLPAQMRGASAGWTAALVQLMAAGQHHDLKSRLDSIDGGPVFAVIGMIIEMALAELRMIDVVIPMLRGRHAQGRGLAAEADRWFEVALEAAASAETSWTPIVLIAADRLDEAREHLSSVEAAGAVSDDFIAFLALRAEDVTTAGAAFDRTGARPAETADWRVALTGAELALAEGDPGSALAFASHGISIFEEGVSRLLRDTDRVEACDNPDATALYLTALKALLQLADDEGAFRDDHLGRAFELLERARSLAIVHLLHDDPADSAGVAGRAWREAAATWAAAVDRLLLGIDEAPPVDTQPLLAEVDDTEARLRDVEVQLAREAPGMLVRRRAPATPLRLAAVQERLPADTVLLEYHTVRSDLLICAVTKHTVRVEHRRVSGRRLAAMVHAHHRRCADGMGAGDDCDQLASLLLEPVADVVRAHHRVVVVPFGPLNLVPVHALPFDDAPLGLTHVVSYAPAAAVGVPLEFDRPVPLGRVAIVGDPAFDQEIHTRLRRLPGAVMESRVIASILETPDVLIGADAVETDVRNLVQGRNVIHLATHGWLDELAPYASSLVLAGHDQLTVAELVGLRVGADLAVLSACNTGRGAATLGGDVVGLTRAMLAAGVRRLVVSLWPVDDVTACVTMAWFYEFLAARMPAASALAKAQACVHGLDHGGLRARYAALCDMVGSDAGDLDAADYRRGELDLPPELRDLEEIPPPLGGEAERHWAPFILVGA